MWDNPDNTTPSPLTSEQQAAAQRRLEKGLQDLPDVTELMAALKDGADPNCTVFGCALPLHVAIEKNSAHAMALLIVSGAEVNGVAQDGGTALDEAIRMRSDEAIRFLQEEAGGKTRRKLDEDGEVIFSYQDMMNYRLASVFSVPGSRYERARKWLAKGADPDAQDNGYSLLQRAIARLDIGMVELLLEAGADIHRPSTQGWQPLDLLWGCSNKDLLTPDWHKMLNFLEEKGCRDLFFKRPKEMTLEDMRQSVPGDKEKTFLHLFAEAHRFDIVISALKRDPDARMTAGDFLKKDWVGTSLLSVLGRDGLRWDIFTPQIWQGRLGEMTRVWEQVIFPSQKDRERFAKAQQDVIDYRNQMLKAKRSKVVLKKGPHP